MKNDDEFWNRVWEPDTAHDEYEWSKKHGWIKGNIPTPPNNIQPKKSESKNSNSLGGKGIAIIAMFVAAIVLACINPILTIICMIVFGVLVWSCVKK